MLHGVNCYDISILPLRNPESFVSGGLHKHVDERRKILSSGEGDEVLSYIEEVALLIECLHVIKLSIQAVYISFFSFEFWEDNCLT